MTTEPKATKKNPDYTASAVKMCNPPEFKVALEARAAHLDRIANLKAQLEAYPEWGELQFVQNELVKHDEMIHSMIDSLGSYQDIERGLYAVKQRKLTKQYSAGQFEANYPEFAPAVIKKAVDTVKLNGLVKGGLISEDAMRRALVMTETETFAYIIR